MKTKRIRSKITIASLTVSMLFVIMSFCMAPRVESAYSAVAKPMEFYLHNFDIPVNVAGLQSKYIMNTTRSFKFSTQQDAYTNSFYKPTDQPKTTVDFYLYPNFAGPVTVNGLWQLSLWVNGSAYKPTRFSLYFQEIAEGGVAVWNETAQDCTVTSAIGEYIDVPVNNYNLSVTLSHNFSAGTTLHVQVEVNTGSSADARIWYDSPLYPSKVILPTQDYARANTIKTYSYDNSENTLFYYNWNDSQRVVIARANVTDPFGTYDISKVKSSVTDAAGNTIVNDVDMNRTSDVGWIGSYAQVYELRWSYPTNATIGNYTVIVTVVDNNGYYRNIDLGSYNPFVEENTQTFMIGSPADLIEKTVPFWLLPLVIVLIIVIALVTAYLFYSRRRKAI